MKFEKLYDLTLNEMARVSKSQRFSNTKINPIEVTPEKVTNIKMYLLDLNNFDDKTKADIFNNIINSLKNETFETYQDLENAVKKQISENIAKLGGKQNTTQLGYTTRVVLNTLDRLKVLDTSEAKPIVTKEEETEQKGDKVFNIDFEKSIEGIDAVNSDFVSIITTAVKNTIDDYEKKQINKVSETKLQYDLSNALQQAMEDSDVVFRDVMKAKIKKAAAGPTGIPMDAVIKTLADSEFINDINKKKTEIDSETGEVPVFDPQEDEEPEEFTSADVERMTGGYKPEQDYDWERSGGVDFG